MYVLYLYFVRTSNSQYIISILFYNVDILQINSWNIFFYTYFM